MRATASRPCTPARPSRGAGAVLVLRALGLGDFLTGVPAYRALRAAFPQHELVLAAPSGLSPLLALTRSLDRLLPTGELAPVPWRGPPPDVAVDLHGNGPESRRLIAGTGARLRLAFGGAGHRGPPWDGGEHEVARWCRMLRWWGVPADPGALHLAPPPRASPLPGCTLIHPGAAFASRRWPPERFAVTAAGLEAAGHRVAVTGGPGERALAVHVARLAGLPAGRVFTALDLGELAALVARARLVVCGDTGLAHLAFAYARPSVTLYGPVSPALWGPPPDPRHRVIWHGLGDRPGDAHGPRPDTRLLAITPDEVLREAHLLTAQPT